MLEIFRGWKRKLGIVTLMLALMIFAIWIKILSQAVDLGYSDTDVTGKRVYELIAVSAGGRLLWWGHRPRATHQSWEAIRSWSLDLESQEYIDFDDGMWATEWSLRGCGLEVGHANVSSEEAIIDNVQFWVIPYWLIDLPLILLTAWLFCSNSSPRNKTVKSPEDQPRYDQVLIAPSVENCIT